MENRISKLIARQLRDLYHGGNWTSVCLKDRLKGLDWNMATTKIENFNTIATLVCHITYYTNPVLKVLKGGALLASDKDSFIIPSIKNEDDWKQLQTGIFADTEALAAEIEKMDDAILDQDFTDAKYGTYFRNLNGIIEHGHYHLGQISLLRKMIKGD